MKARGPLLLLVCALVALPALPAGTASAKPGYVVKPKSLRLSLPLPASKGYSASIQTEGHRKVSLKISKGSISATYVALGHVTRKGIEADFGDFGRVSLRFKAKARTPIPALKRCKGRQAVGERGVFLGNVSFEGERGYTRVAAHRLKGKVIRRYKQVCKRKPGASASKVKVHFEEVYVAAEAQRFGVRRFLLAAEVSLTFAAEEFASTLALGSERKKVGAVGVTKLAFALEEIDSIETSPAGERPVSAEVTMRKPFEGSASYLREGKAPPTWTGTLGVRLPGSGLVPLAGPEFDVEICRDTFELPLGRCFESIGSDFGQGSGSHSQPLALARLSSLR